MFSLAHIADIYNPLLLVISIALSIYWGIKFKSARGLMLVISAVVVYSLMFLDLNFKIWPSFGLDYSTHTATALAMCFFIGATLKKVWINILLLASLLAYGELMVILNYHSWLDIFSTGIVVGLVLYFIYFFLRNSRFLKSK